MRWMLSTIGVGILTVGFGYLLQVMTPEDLHLLVIAAVAIPGATLTVALIDWLLWNRDKRLDAELRDAVRDWELFTGKVLGTPSNTIDQVMHRMAGVVGKRLRYADLTAD